MNPRPKPSPRPIRRPAAGARRDHDEIVILLPDPHVLRVIARSVLLAAALLSLPWLRAALPLACDPAAAPAEPGPKWIDTPFALRMLVADLKREGLLDPQLRNLFVGDPGSRAHFLNSNRIDLMSPGYKKMFVDTNSVDFVLAADGPPAGSSLGFVDRVLKVGGIVAVRLGSGPSDTFCLPPNYRMVYIRRFGSTVVAIKKISHGNAGEFGGGARGRRLLSVGPKGKTTMYLEDFKLVMMKMMGLLPRYE